MAMNLKMLTAFAAFALVGVTSVRAQEPKSNPVDQTTTDGSSTVSPAQPVKDGGESNPTDKSADDKNSKPSAPAGSSPAPIERQTDGEKFRVENSPVDTLKGEVSCLKEFQGARLVRSTTKYTNNDLRVVEYNNDGTIHGVVELQSGNLKTTLFSDDGKGLKSILTTSKGTVTNEEYRPDGKTIWTRRITDTDSRRSEYFGPDGKLRVIRTIAKSGQMSVKVLDKRGVELYEQIWVPGFAGYTITEVREATATGERRIKILSKQVESVDYYRNGSLEKTEEGEKLSDPFDLKRIEELDPTDDPTVPKSPRPRK